MRVAIAVGGVLAMLLLALVLVLSGGEDREPSGGDTGAVAEQLEPVAVGSMTVASEAAGHDLEITFADPPNAGDDRGLLVFLHGQGGSPGEFTANLALLEALRRLGDRAPAVAFPEGGERGYWHDREEAEWQRWVFAEAIPAAARRLGTEPGRVAIGGISMGGFGAYSLALASPRRFCAAGGHSAAIWPRFEEAFEGAFDGPVDFARHDLLRRAGRSGDPFRGIPVWNDYGADDWFVTGNERFVELLEAAGTDLTAHVWPGGHDATYWNAHWGEYLRFYSRALAKCEAGGRLR